MTRRTKISALEAHLGFWLRFVSNQVSHAFGLKVAACGVSVAEWVVMRELYDRDETMPSELAVRIGMTRGGITKIVDRLDAKGLATRTANESDRRSQMLALTAKGRALVPRLAALADENDAEFFGHLGDDEREQIERTMREIVQRHGLKSVPLE